MKDISDKRLSDIFKYSLGWGILISVVGIVVLLFFKQVEVASKEIVFMALGGLLTKLSTVYDHIFGSSKSSEQKTEAQVKLMEQLAENVKSDSGDELTVDTFYRINDDVYEDGKKYVCVKEYLTTQTLTVVSADKEHWKLA